MGAYAWSAGTERRCEVVSERNAKRLTIELDENAVRGVGGYRLGSCSPCETSIGPVLLRHEIRDSDPFLGQCFHTSPLRARSRLSENCHQALVVAA